MKEYILIGLIAGVMIELVFLFKKYYKRNDK